MKMTDPLVRKVQGFCRKWDMLGGTVLCAVSGGRDSMALLHVLSALAVEEGFQVAAAHFNHQLRPSADRDEAFVRDWCRSHGIPLTCGRGDAGGFAKREGLSVEDAARTLRYAFLETAATDMGADRIATAHHREDNAETVLLHLLRGAGLQGLGGIPPVRGKIVRPLLEVGRDDINSYIQEHSIPYVEDETNQCRDYTRNRLRLEVLPLLEEIAPGCGARIAGTAALLREENDHIRWEVDKLLPVVENDAVTLPVAVLAGQDSVLRRRLVRAMGERLGVSLTQRQTDAVLALGSGGFLDLPGGLCAVRSRQRLTLKKRSPPLPVLMLCEGSQVWGSWRVAVERRVGPVEESDCRAVLRDTGGVLAVASWDGTGRLAVENGCRTIKRLFVDRGIPVERRGEHPAVLVDGRAAAVIGVATGREFIPDTDEPCWVVTLLPGES